MDRKINIAVIDSFELFRTGFSMLIENAGYSVHSSFKNGQQFIKQLDMNNLPDFVFIEIEKPESLNLQTILLLKKTYPSIYILALAIDYVKETITQLTSCGANGFIQKDAEPGEIKSAINTVLKKGSYFPKIDKGRSRLS